METAGNTVSETDPADIQTVKDAYAAGVALACG